MTATLILTRVCSSDKGTFGVITHDNIPLCVTCEDPWNDNRRNISCIPTGTYTCLSHSGAKYKDVWTVTNVPNRDGILIHQGNTTNHTEGCILVGRGFFDMGGTPSISDSRITLDMLRQKLPDSFNLTIREA